MPGACEIISCGLQAVPSFFRVSARRSTKQIGRSSSIAPRRHRENVFAVAHTARDEDDTAHTVRQSSASYLMCTSPYAACTNGAVSIAILVCCIAALSTLLALSTASGKRTLLRREIKQVLRRSQRSKCAPFRPETTPLRATNQRAHNLGNKPGKLVTARPREGRNESQRASSWAAPGRRCSSSFVWLPACRPCPSHVSVSRATHAPSAGFLPKHPNNQTTKIQCHVAEGRGNCRNDSALLI